MAGRRGGIVGTLLEAAGVAIVPKEQLQEQFQLVDDARLVTRSAERLAYAVLNGYPDYGGDIDPTDRLKLVRAAREVADRDPQAGAAIELMNDFVFGRGVPRPRAKDQGVQDIVDEAWDDPDNQRVLTSFEAQLAIGSDLSIQCNLFLLAFPGDDGRVKLSLLAHDTVTGAVTDPENRLRVLYYKSTERKMEWDYKTDLPKWSTTTPVVIYYQDVGGVDEVQEEGRTVEAPPKEKLRPGLVYHVRINRGSERIFGMPTFRRLLKWFTAYNEFLASRVDVAKAAAALLYKKKVTGGQSAVEREATRLLSRSGTLGQALSYDAPQAVPQPGSGIVENQSVEYTPFNLPTGAAEAAQTAQMIRASLSASTRFPQSYFGDATNSNLATATSLELPVLKAVETRQSVWEGVFRWFIDYVIEVAVDTGRIPPAAEPTLAEIQLREAHADAIGDEEETERDLGYEFKMPSPLKRAMTDLMTAIQGIAQMIDPNGSNVALSRFLLTYALGEVLEVEDVADAVKEILPDGYVDPMLAAYQAQQAGAPPPGEAPPPGDSTATGADGQQHPPENPYGAPQKASPPEAQGVTEGLVVHGRAGPLGVLRLQEGRIAQLDPEAQKAARDRHEELEALYTEDVVPVIERTLAELDALPATMNGSH